MRRQDSHRGQPVRALQQEFGLAPVTIRKAVHQLRDEGLVRTTPGWGTYVVKQEEKENDGVAAGAARCCGGEVRPGADHSPQGDAGLGVV